MLNRTRHLVLSLLTSQRAQATIEYALVIGVAMILLVGVSGLVVDGLSRHYREVTSVVCLPIP